MSARGRSASTCRSTCSWPNPFFAQAVIVAKDVAARDRLQAKLEQVLAEEFPNVVARVSPLELGPPVGWPVQYRVSGPDPSVVRVDRASTSPRSWPRARTRCGPISTGSSRRARCASASTRTRPACSGLSSEALAGVLNTVITGTPVTQVRDDIYLVDVRGPRHRRAARVARRRCRPCRCRCPTAAPCRSASSPRSSSPRTSR